MVKRKETLINEIARHTSVSDASQKFSTINISVSQAGPVEVRNPHGGVPLSPLDKPLLGSPVSHACMPRDADDIELSVGIGNA